jgi:Mn-containing catalase
MFYTDYRLQYPVRVETPRPVFAKALQQAIGGIEGEIRVAMQYMFQAWGTRGNNKYREMLLNTGAEELGHIEMLATAVALNLENAPLSLQEEVAADPVSGAVLNGTNSGISSRPGSRLYPSMPAACRSTCPTSTPAATFPLTCMRTSPPRRPAGRSRSGSTT